MHDIGVDFSEVVAATGARQYYQQDVYIYIEWLSEPVAAARFAHRIIPAEGKQTTVKGDRKSSSNDSSNRTSHWQQGRYSNKDNVLVTTDTFSVDHDSSTTSRSAGVPMPTPQLFEHVLFLHNSVRSVVKKRNLK
jgi:hypothetical protein